MSKERSGVNFSAWRMKDQLLRFTGVRYPNGEVSLQPRPVAPEPRPDSKEVLEFNQMLVAQPLPNKSSAAD